MDLKLVIFFEHKLVSRVLTAGRILYFLCVGFMLAGIVATPFYGFGVDSQENIYVGMGHQIQVYGNGENIATITRGTSRGYAFTIQEDDTILIASGSNVYVFDQTGTIRLDHWQEDDAATHSRLRKEKYSFTSSSGDIYTAVQPFGLLSIYKENTLVYRMPIFDYAIMLLLFTSLPIFTLSIFRDVLLKWFYS